MNTKELLEMKAKEYGNAIDNMGSLAETWTWALRRKGFLKEGLKLEADDVCLMMALFKISRELGVKKPDLENYIDVMGYTQIAIDFHKSKEVSK